MDPCASNKSPPFKRQRKIPKQSPSKSPIIEAFLRSKEKQAIVRNVQTFCAKCGMNVLSPKVVIERLTLPKSTVVNLKEGFKKFSISAEAVTQSPSSLKSCVQSRNERPLSVSEKSHFNQQFFDERSQTPVSGQRGHGPQQPFFLVDSWASRNRSHGGITKKKNTHQAVSLRKAEKHELLSKVNGTSPSSRATSNGTATLDGCIKVAIFNKVHDVAAIFNMGKAHGKLLQTPPEVRHSVFDQVSDSVNTFPLAPTHFSLANCKGPTTSESKIFNCSTPDTSVNGSKKLSHRFRRDSVDSDESFHTFSLSADDDDDDDEEEEEETLKPLDEIMQIAAQPVNDRLKQLLKTPCYDNNLELLVKEKKASERIDAIEKQLHKDLERGQGVADEERNGDQDGELTDEHRDILKKFSVVSNAIPDYHPGEEIFHLSKSGAIFNISTLNLQHLQFTAGSSEEMIIFRPGNQLMLATEGFLTTLYQFRKCPEILMKWMFQMVSVHPSYATSIKLLHTLIEITCNHLTHLEEKPWVPTILDIVTVFTNMGIEFKTLFPLPHIQPGFSDIDLKSAVPGSVSEEQGSLCTEQIFSCVPEFQIAHVIKFLGLCTAVYKESYLDLEILALLVMLLKIHLEKEMKDIPVMDLHCLIANLLQNIEDWVNVMPELCFAMSELSNHHHNFLKLLQLVPTFEFRGREIRRHVSLIFISNIRKGHCTDIPLDYESRMLLLCKCLSQMKPSSLVKKMQTIPDYQSKTLADLDQEAYYLTFTLLHLVNDASSSDEPLSIQRKYLLKLCTELEKHIKSDIREDARFFYRTKVKDLVARIHGRWQELLLYSRPNQGKLHDYWQPGCDSSSPPSSQESVDEDVQGNILSDHK
ncbi:PREDICTED: SMC5-SMC6 complex localization factor protein 2 [Nanorana parkeri]|uniref:SMC5-SMC6 complex localization factor protein 2 n=1 Tax=Nanorana parkeri TaxID=125878 RepID=UPI000854C942|nr:PREDICTED: SMC5-SMC6 complex localization factor protein 2 [Nanorana parkeri]